MKRLLSFVLAALMLTALFCACDTSSSDGSEKVYSFKSGSVTITPGADMSSILSALGEYKSYDESTSCAFDGLDKVYTYSGFSIQTYPDGDKDYVYIITLTSDLVSTPEGVSVGSTKSDVIAAYGDGYATVGDGNMQYDASNCVLQFIFRDGKVSSIKYTAKV